MLSVIMLNVVLSVIILNVVMLTVEEPSNRCYHCQRHFVLKIVCVYTA